MLRAVFALALVLSACSRAPSTRDAGAPTPRAAAPTRPIVVLVTLDTTRADRLHAYGYDLGRTPALDAIAAEGVRVEHAVAVAPLTAPSHSSMLTGLYPAAHGVRDNGSYRLGQEHVTVAEAFREGGYATYAFVSAFVLDRRYGLDQGFDVYDDDLADERDPELFMIRERRGDRTVARALERIREHQRTDPRRPFFAWVHLFDVHQPHAAPWSDRARTTTPYDAEVSFVDRQVGALIEGLRELGLYDRTALLVTADHGESLGEHGEATHGYFVYESTMHVPLLVRAPWLLPRGYLHRGTASGVDVGPTLLALARLPALADVAGRSLVADVVARRGADDRVVFSEAKLTELGFGMAPLYAARDARYTFVQAPRPELYDRDADPGELQDRAREVPAESARLGAAIEGWFAENARRSRGEARAAIDTQTLDALRALGYVGDVPPGQAPSERDAGAADEPAIDPKDGLAVHELLETARHLAREGDWAGSRALAERGLRINPRNVSALNVHGLASAHLGDVTQAIEIYGRSLAIVPEQPRVETMLGEIEARRGRPSQALAHLDRAVALMPGLIDAQLQRAEVLRALHREAEADATLRRLLEITSERPRIHRMLGEIAFERGDYASAAASFRLELEGAPRSAPAHHALALALHRMHEEAAALVEAQRASALRGDVWQYAYDEACVLAVLERGEEALAALGRAVEAGLDQPALLASDDDLASLRADPRFEALRRRAAHAPSGVRRPDAAGDAASPGPAPRRPRAR